MIPKGDTLGSGMAIWVGKTSGLAFWRLYDRVVAVQITRNRNRVTTPYKSQRRSSFRTMHLLYVLRRNSELHIAAFVDWTAQ